MHEHDNFDYQPIQGPAMTETSAEAAVASHAIDPVPRATPVTVDFSALTSAQIQQILAEGQQHLAKNAAQLKRQARESTAAHAKSLGYTIDDLFPSRGATVTGAAPRAPGSKAKTGVHPPKYANPADLNETWAGRGKRPRWFSEHLAGGGSAEDLLITKP